MRPSRPVLTLTCWPQVSQSPERSPPKLGYKPSNASRCLFETIAFAIDERMSAVCAHQEKQGTKRAHGRRHGLVRVEVDDEPRMLRALHPLFMIGIIVASFRSELPGRS